MNQCVASQPNHVMQAPLICAYCERPLTDEETEGPCRDEDGEIMCDECYSEHYEYLCPLCQNLVAVEGNEKHILVTHALADNQAMEPGIYRVLELPWFTSNYFSMRIHQHALKREADLPEEASDMVCGDNVCEECAKAATKPADA